MSFERIVVFTGGLSQPVRKNIVEIDRAIPGLTWLILLHSPRKALPQLLRAQWHNLRREGWRRIPSLASAVRRRLLTRVPGPVPAQSPGREYAFSVPKSRLNLRLVEVPDIHAPECSKRSGVRAGPGPLLVGADPAPLVVRDPATRHLEFAQGQVAGVSRDAAAFWELWNDEKTVGCTVHRVEARLDTGATVAATTIDRDRYATVRGMQLRLDEVGIDLMRGPSAGSLAARPTRYRSRPEERRIASRP